MSKEDRQDEIFNAVKVAFIKKHQAETTNRLSKDLKQLLKLREGQIAARCRDLLLRNVPDLSAEQIETIKDLFK